MRAQVATKVVASMLALESLDATADIKLYINSQGALRACARAWRLTPARAPKPERSARGHGTNARCLSVPGAR